MYICIYEQGDKITFGRARAPGSSITYLLTPRLWGLNQCGVDQHTLWRSRVSASHCRVFFQRLGRTCLCTNFKLHVNIGTTGGSCSSGCCLVSGRS